MPKDRIDGDMHEHGLFSKQEAAIMMTIKLDSKSGSVSIGIGPRSLVRLSMSHSITDPDDFL